MLDITNQRFGKLVAIKPVGKNKSGQYKWLCQCDCGNQVNTTAHQLISGNTKSCGCLQKDATLRNQKLATKAVIKNGTSKNILSTYTRSNTDVRGISYNKLSHKYDVSLIYQGKTRFRKSYDNLNDAIKARKAAEEKWIEPLRHDWDKKE